MCGLDEQILSLPSIRQLSTVEHINIPSLFRISDSVTLQRVIHFREAGAQSARHDDRSEGIVHQDCTSIVDVEGSHSGQAIPNRLGLERT